jgi:hypothetical protein
MRTAIPGQWRKAVSAILHAAQRGTILVRQRPRNDWRNLDSQHFDAGLYAVLADALDVSGVLHGKKHTDMDEEGECYSFTFRYRPPSAKGELDLYTKINLMPDGQVVIVYSVHT